MWSVTEPVAQLVAARWWIARLVPRAGAGLMAALIVANVVLGLLPVVFLVATSVVLGRVPAALAAGTDSAAWRSLVTAFVVAGAAIVVQQLLTPLVTALGELMARRIDGQVFAQLIAASLRPAGLAPIEDQRVRDDLAEAARELEFGFQSPGRACAGLLALIARYLQLVGYCVAVGVGFSWWAATAVGATTMLFRYGQRGGLRKYAGIFPKLTGGRRETDYLRELATGALAAKEIRVFGLVPWLTDRYRRAYLSWTLPVWAARRKAYLKPFYLITAIGLLATGVVLGGLGAQGTELSLTSLALVLQAVLGSLRLGDHYPESDVPTQFGMNAFDAVRAFEQKMAGHSEHVPAERERGPVPPLERDLRFEGVSFGYPGQSGLVLDGLDLTIQAGRSTAIVGVNGAGKTTLVKLLARLYEPGAGVVRADDVDIRSYGVADWRTQIGVIFQDYLRFEASAAENIGFGAVEHVGDRAGIVAAAEAANIADVLRELPDGFDTPLARHMAGGADLSGGQWQRVAIARALFALRQGASILVLDEPTASLDVRAEAEFYERFIELTRGATTVLISHRFSTVRLADHIVVLVDGRVVEQGSHEDLMRLDGRYAELFRLQAARFTEESGAEQAETEVEVPR